MHLALAASPAMSAPPTMIVANVDPVEKESRLILMVNIEPIDKVHPDSAVAGGSVDLRGDTDETWQAASASQMPDRTLGVAMAP
ncbi:MAG TPA: DUF2380 domain-containing protein [Rhodanobacter sp.]